jgi:hypothetical protein
VPHSLPEGEAVGMKVQKAQNASSLAEMRAIGWEQALDDLSKAAGPRPARAADCKHAPSRMGTS